MSFRIAVLSLAGVSAIVGSVTAQDGPCAGKMRTTPIGGSYGATAMAVQGDLMVTADSDSVTSWGLSNPDAPERLGQWISVADGRSYGVNGRMAIDTKGFVYVGNGHPYYLEIFDFRVPSNPRPVSHIAANWYDFILMGDFLVGSGAPFDVVNISDPFRPVPVCDGCFSPPFHGPPSWGGAAAIARFGEWIAAVEFDQFWIIDVGDPSEPAVVSTVELDRFHTNDVRLWVGSDRALVWSTNAAHVIDLSDPLQPVAHELDFLLQHVQWADFHGRTVYLGDWAHYDVVGLDLTDPGQPEELEPFGGYSHNGLVDGDRLYLSKSTSLDVLSLDGGSPVAVGEVGWLRAGRISVDGAVGIVSGYRSLRSLDLRATGSEMVRDQMLFDETLWYHTIEGSTVVVGMNPPAFAVMTVDQDFSLVETARVPLGDCFPYVPALNGDLLAMPLGCPDGSGAVELYDLSDPADPRRRSRFGTEASSKSAAFRGERLFVSAGGTMLEVDVSNPGEPEVRAVLPIAEGVSRLDAIVDAGECLLVGASVGNTWPVLAAIDVTFPDDPVVLATADDGPIWLAASDGVVAGGSQSELFLTRCPSPGEELSVASFEYPRSSTGGGDIANGTLYLAARHSIDELDLECTQPEVDFRWYRFGTRVYFEDLTTLAKTWYEPERIWRWTLPDRTVTSPDSRALVKDFEIPGAYSITLQVVTELGSSSVTKTIDLPLQSGLSPNLRPASGRIVPDP